VRKFWKKLPIGVRSNFHKWLHRFNSAPILLRISAFRHYRTVGLIRSSANPVQLRIGESHSFPGWISTNFQVITKNFLDATKFYGRESCSAIFADNVIEHLDRNSGELLVTNAYEALVTGGILRITTPDLHSIVMKYVEGSTQDVRQFASDLKGHGLDIEIPSDLLRVTFSAFGHHKGIIYDFNSLKVLLESVGFSKVSKFSPGVSSSANLSNLETRVGESDMWSQMAVEATKP
jgi:predicted SAM-dependent methyltransferase